jgi:diguanylate cyclase (GGDEF)-like protein
MLHIRFNTSVVEDAEVDSPFGKGAHLFAVQCAEQISLAIANVKLRDELRDQSTKDPLTGLFNRRHFLDECRREITNADRYNQKVGLISIDVDHFKMFNDTHGHDAGDVVLRGIGDLMMDLFDGGEVVARFGGEEFSILLPNLTTEETQARAEALRKKVEALTITYADKPLPKISISAGVAEFPTCGRTPQEVLKSADKALYAAKDGGRNMVCLAGSLEG